MQPKEKMPCSEVRLTIGKELQLNWNTLEPEKDQIITTVKYWKILYLLEILPGVTGILNQVLPLLFLFFFLKGFLFVYSPF